jgi:hypothetical protein
MNMAKEKLSAICLEQGKLVLMMKNLQILP